MSGLSTLVNTSYCGAFNSLLSGRRQNEGGNKKHYDISKLEAAEKKSPRFYPQAEILGINLAMINHCAECKLPTDLKPNRN